MCLGAKREGDPVVVAGEPSEMSMMRVELGRSWVIPPEDEFPVLPGGGNPSGKPGDDAGEGEVQ